MYGWYTIEEHPDPNGQMTALGSASSKFASVNRPAIVSRPARKTTISGLSEVESLSHRLKIMNGFGALSGGESFTLSRTSSGDFLYRSPFTFPRMPYERK